MGSSVSRSPRHSTSHADRIPQLFGDQVLNPNINHQQMQALFIQGSNPDIAFMAPTKPAVDKPEVKETHTVRNEVNLKKNTLKLTVDPDNEYKHAISFDFDSTKPCTVQVHFGAAESIHRDGRSTFDSVQPQQGPPVEFPAGLSQSFVQDASEWLDMSKFDRPSHDLVYEKESSMYPVVIILQVVNDEEEEETEVKVRDKRKSILSRKSSSARDKRSSASSTKSSATNKSDEGDAVPEQSQTTYATLTPHGTTWVVEAIKQKIRVGGENYELQEIFGISAGETEHDDAETDGEKAESKGADAANDDESSDDDDDESQFCVICLSEPKDTTVLPCRHMCLCGACAEALRAGTNQCPICRTTVTNFLQIKVNAKK